MAANRRWLAPVSERAACRIRHPFKSNRGR